MFSIFPCIAASSQQVDLIAAGAVFSPAYNQNFYLSSNSSYLIAANRSNEVWFSTDGFVFTKVTSDHTLSNPEFSVAIKDSGRIAVISTNGLAISNSSTITSGTTWIASTPYTNAKHINIANGYYVVTTSTYSAPNGRFYYASDPSGVFTAQNVATSSALAGKVIYDATLGKYFCAVQNHGVVMMDGSFSPTETTISLTGAQWRGVASSNSGHVVLFGNNSSIQCILYTSSDGTTWTAQTLGIDGYVASATYGNGKFAICTTSQLSNGLGTIRYSLDNGVTWYNVSAPSGIDWYDSTYKDGYFYFAGEKYSTGRSVLLRVLIP